MSVSAITVQAKQVERLEENVRVLREALSALTAVVERQPRISKSFPEAGSPLGLARAALAKTEA